MRPTSLFTAKCVPLSCYNGKHVVAKNQNFRGSLHINIPRFVVKVCGVFSIPTTTRARFHLWLLVPFTPESTCHLSLIEVDSVNTWMFNGLGGL